MPQDSDRQQLSFQQKLLLVAVVVILLWIIKATFNVLLLILAGALIALYFRGLSGLIHRKLHLSEKWSLPVAIIGSLLLLLLFFWLAGSKINQQVQQLSQTLPSTVAKAKQQISQSPVGQQILQQVQSGGSMQKAASTLQSFFRSTFGVLGDVYVILFLGLFFTAAPKTYRNGFLALFTSEAKPRAEGVTNKVGLTLTKWLKGKIFSMLIVAVLTIIGLLLIGVPMAFTLGLIAGLLNFIPNFGPLIALIPAVLVGLLQGPTTALLVAGLYILVQVLESNVITPQIQKRLIEIPPAIIIIAQLFMGVLTGGWGLVLATPVVAILMVVVQELWIKKQHGK
ncbi:MAG TPA: AI-2E family transporter [Flavisolibacter sp.]|jgi:predicted PurR-regulated permease PerM|nr:AI-2E family transporter [Flavisolibacter sp.]